MAWFGIAFANIFISIVFVCLFSVNKDILAFVLLTVKKKFHSGILQLPFLLSGLI